MNIFGLFVTTISRNISVYIVIYIKREREHIYTLLPYPFYGMSISVHAKGVIAKCKRWRKNAQNQIEPNNSDDTVDRLWRKRERRKEWCSIVVNDQFQPNWNVLPFHFYPNFIKVMLAEGAGPRWVFTGDSRSRGPLLTVFRIHEREYEYIYIYAFAYCQTFTRVPGFWLWGSLHNRHEIIWPVLEWCSDEHS